MILSDRFIRYMIRYMAYMIGFSTLTCSSSVFALSPSGKWMSHHTPHFEIVYPEGHSQIAAKYARYAEMSYDLLIPIFKEAPDKTVVVIDTSRDISNGYATFLPYPHIVLYPVLPDSLNSVSHYDNWGMEFMIHEYTHILAFEAAHGFYTPLRYIFGNLIRPNSLLPGWFHEGLAVEMETRLTKYGRLRAPETSAAIRALVAGNRLFDETIDRINEGSIPTWPFGRRRYLMGSLLWKHMMDTRGVKSVDSLLQHYSRQVPYLLNIPAREFFGKNYDQLLKELYIQMDLQARAQISKIQSRGQPKDREVQLDGLVQYSPSVSPTGSHLTVINVHRYRGTELMILDSHEKLVDKIGGSGFLKVSWASNGKFFVYDRLGLFDRRNTFYDLYKYDLESQKSQRLTKGERAHEPSVSPDGRSVAYIKTRPGGTDLYLLDLSNNSSHKLYQPPWQVRLSRPEFINKNEILFAQRSLSGKENFYVHNLKDHTRRAVLEKFETVSNPRRTKKGVLFSSSHSGVHNLYLTNPNDLSHAEPITNTTTEIINGDLDPIRHQVYFTKLTPWGRKIFVQSGYKKTNPPQLSPSSMIPGKKYKEPILQLTKPMQPTRKTKTVQPTQTARLA